MEKLDVLKNLNDNFKQEVKNLFVFKDYEYKHIEDELVLKGFNVLIVTKDDKTYGFGENTYSQLGFGHNKVMNEPQIANELCDQQIIDLKNQQISTFLYFS